MILPIEEISLPNTNRKKPLFIDYSEINGSPDNRLRFLRALLKIIDLNDAVIHYDDLGLNCDNIEPFKEYLKTNYPDICRIHKKTLNMDDFDGKIICNIDLLVEDSLEILSQNQKLTDSIRENQNIVSSKNEIQSNFHDENKEIMDDLKKPSHRYIFEIFNGKISLAETQLFVDKIIKKTDPENIEAIFNLSSLIEEIGKIPLKIKNKQTNFEDEELIKEILLKIINKFATYLSNKQYWEKLSIDINHYFLKILKKCDQEKLTISFDNGKKYDVTIAEILLNDNIKIFRAKLGIPDEYDRNAIISEYQNKKALFNFSCDLTKEISLDDFVLAEIIGFRDTYIIINPLKILTGRETSELLSLGVECYPSIEMILSKISEVNE
jgi:hypothetical protein